MKRNPATQAQVDAADPTASTWLSANAGSGKTRVLTDRVARLLLAGTDPQHILCLTYTKAAASEMQNRLFERLGEWAMMPDAELRRQLQTLGAGADGTRIELRDARKLFAAAIETPGGLKIQTIHSFCAGILRRFPVEAGISPQFREMEEHETDLLRKEVLEDMASDADQQALVDALARHYTGDDISGLLAEVTGKRSIFARTKESDVSTQLGLEPGASVDDAIAIAFEGPVKQVADDVNAAFSDQSKSYKAFGKNLAGLNYDNPDRDDLCVLYEAFLYANKSSRSRNFPQSNHGKALDAVAHCIDELHAWMDQVADAWDFELRVALRDRSIALLSFAKAFIARYEDRKRAKGAMDFDDLITRTRLLLSDSVMAQWVLFRLDGGVDHILVDEAQDTAPEQWEVIRLLAQEFTAGVGAHADRNRTIFVVGDKKQSIYSFQGADPEGFDRMNTHFGTALGEVGSELKQRDLRYSFRSSRAVLGLVDQVFQGPLLEGLGDGMTHLAFHSEQPGRVDLWPVIETRKVEPPEWDDPIDTIPDAHHEKQLAQRIAREIQRMTREEWITVKKGNDWVRRPVTEGDVLILVRRRRTLFSEIISACKKLGVNIAGADRMILGDDLAVRDILALMHFLALPEDDLSLASALKSPLFGWSEKQLYDLAHPRPEGMTLWEALRSSEAKYVETLQILHDLRDNADFLRPYDVINRILLRHDGRRRLIERLGPEAEDGLDALLSQALSYEQGEVPSLTGFLGWFEGEEIVVKRQMDSNGDRVRVMTVHGSKGLEAPIVILPDCTVLKREFRGNILTGNSAPLWKANKPEMPGVAQNLDAAVVEAGDREFRRLLYVALTRAESWLIVAAAGDVGDNHHSWYNMVSDALAHLPATTVETVEGPVSRFEHGDWNAAPEIERADRADTLAPPHGFGRTVPELLDASKTLAPSDLGGPKALPGESDTDQEVALARGRLVHTLLETLPAIAPEDRPAVAAALAETAPDAALVPNRGQVVAEALTMLASQDLAHLFAKGLAEVPVTATIPALDGHRIHGAIDLLVIEDDTVLAIDFKSNRVIPDRPEAIPLGLLRQMAAYRDALLQIYPGRTIETALLWTRTADLMHLPDPLLTDALLDVSVP